MKPDEEQWETESLRWIHEVRRQNYERTKHLKLRDLPRLSCDEVAGLAAELGIRYLPPRVRPKDKRP